MAKKPPKKLEQLAADVHEFMKSLGKDQKDHVIVVVTAAYLDAILASMLSRLFIEAKTSDNLLHPEGPLGSFAARANAAYALGLIEKRMLQALQKIGEIRNHFAHHYLEQTFDSPEVPELCEQLVYIDSDFPDPEVKMRFIKTVKDRYLLTIVYIQMSLLAISQGIYRIKAADDLD